MAVSDRVGAGRDLVEPVNPGLIFPCGDVDALAKILRDCILDREKFAQAGRNARKRWRHGLRAKASPDMWMRFSEQWSGLSGAMWMEKEGIVRNKSVGVQAPFCEMNGAGVRGMRLSGRRIRDTND